MSLTRDERNAYQRGYGRAARNAGERVRRVLEIARSYRERSLEAEKEDGTIHRCQSCVRWTRGGPNCLWGHCRADFEYMAGEGSMWVDEYPSKRPAICTHETFGCINWIPNPVSVEGT